MLFSRGSKGKDCQEWDSIPRLENQTATLTQRFTSLGYLDLRIKRRKMPIMQYVIILKLCQELDSNQRPMLRL